MATNQVKEPHKLDADSYFAILPEWILDSDVSAQAIRLFALLNRYANQQGTCVPTQETLAKRMKCGDDTVARAAKELVAIGAIKITGRKKANGYRTSNLYTIRMTAPYKTNTANADIEVIDAPEIVEDQYLTDADTSIHTASARPGNTAPARPGNTAPARPKSESLNQSQLTKPMSLSSIAKKIALENWTPFKATSGESQKTIESRILQSLENGADEKQLAKGIKYLASNGKPVLPGSITDFLGRAAGASTPKGSIAADRSNLWDSVEETF